MSSPFRVCHPSQLWNYSKEPGRGIANMELWVDEVLVYCGDVAAGKPHSVLFTNDADIVAAHRATVRPVPPVPSAVARERPYPVLQVSYCGSQEQDVLCVNERRIVQATRAKPDPTAHGVVIDLAARPTTAIGHA